MTAQELLALGVIEKIIEEPRPACDQNISHIVDIMKSEIANFIQYYCKFSADMLVEQRFMRFRQF